MKISFTGTGCSGKSTLLDKCREYYGDKFTYVTEVTRPIARKGLPITTWLFDQEKVTSDIYEYAWNTLDDILNDIDIIFYCAPVQMEDDGERSINESFQKDIDNMMTQLLFQDDFNRSFKNNLITLEGDVETRFNDIKIAIEQHEYNTIR